MKSRKKLQVLLIVVFLAVFYQYRQDQIKSMDTDAPQITIDTTQIIQVSVQDPKSRLLEGVSATDKQDGDLSEKLVVETLQLINDDGLIEVGYAVADQAANVAKAAREIQYTDYESPKFSLKEPLVYEEHETYDIMSAVSAVDVLDGDIQHRIRATAMTEESISSLGKHYVHFQVTNSLGDTSEIMMPVEIQKSGSFEAELTLTDYLIYLPLGSDFRPKAFLGTFLHRDEETVLKNGLPEDFSMKTTGDVFTNIPGVYPVEYRVTYTVKHETNPEYDQKFTGYSKLIVVVEG